MEHLAGSLAKVKVKPSSQIKIVQIGDTLHRKWPEYTLRYSYTFAHLSVAAMDSVCSF